MEEKYLVCEDSLEGIFTGIYEAYALREGHEHVHIQIGEEDNYRLFAVYLHISPDTVKTGKVARTLLERLGESVYHGLCRAAASCYPDKGEAVYKAVVDAITQGSGRHVMENLRNPYVQRAFELARYTANAGIRCPHQSWRLIHQSRILSVQLKYVLSMRSGISLISPLFTASTAGLISSSIFTNHCFLIIGSIVVLQRS